MPSRACASSRELLERVDPETEVVGIDEGQFFDSGCRASATPGRPGKRVIVAGLDRITWVGRSSRCRS